MPLPVPELPAVAVPVRVAPAVAVELPVRERIAGPLGALGTAVPVLLVRRLVRRLVLLPPAATVAGLPAVATWSAVAFEARPSAAQVAGTEVVPSEQLAAEVRTVPVPELRQLDPGTRRR